MILGLNFKESCLHRFPTLWNSTLILKSSYLLIHCIQPRKLQCIYVVNIMTLGHALKADSSVSNISIVPSQLYQILISNLMNLSFFQSRNTMTQKTNTSSFGESLKTSCHKLHYTGSCGFKQLVDYSKDTQTAYFWRVGLLEHHGENITICLHHEQVLGNVFEQHATTCCSILKTHRRKT